MFLSQNFIKKSVKYAFQGKKKNKFNSKICTEGRKDKYSKVR